MSLTLITPPATPWGVPWPLVTEFVRTTSLDDAVALETLIAAATEAVGDYLGRQLVEATWKLTLDSFPRCGRAIELPRPPAIAITSIEYVAMDGTTTTLSDYQTSGFGGDGTGVIAPAYGQAWPSTRCVLDAVQITWRAGYEAPAGSPSDPAENIPAAIQNAILATVAANYDTRAADLTPSAKGLLGPYKCWSF